MIRLLHEVWIEFGQNHLTISPVSKLEDAFYPDKNIFHLFYVYLLNVNELITTKVFKEKTIFKIEVKFKPTKVMIKMIKQNTRFLIKPKNQVKSLKAIMR